MLSESETKKLMSKNPKLSTQKYEDVPTLTPLTKQVISR